MDCVHRNQLVWKTFSLQGSTDRNAQKVHLDQSLCCVQVQRGKQVEVVWGGAATLGHLLLAVFVTAGTTRGTTVPFPLVPLTTVDFPRTSLYILPRTSHLLE